MTTVSKVGVVRGVGGVDLYGSEPPRTIQDVARELEEVFGTLREQSYTVLEVTPTIGGYLIFGIGDAQQTKPDDTSEESQPEPFQGCQTDMLFARVYKLMREQIGPHSLTMVDACRQVLQNVARDLHVSEIRESIEDCTRLLVQHPHECELADAATTLKHQLGALLATLVS